MYVFGYTEKLDRYILMGEGAKMGEGKGHPHCTLYSSLRFIFMGCLLIFFNINLSEGNHNSRKIPMTTTETQYKSVVGEEG